MVGDLLIRNIPEALKADLADIAAQNRQSLSETAKEALLEGVKAVRIRDAEATLPPGQLLRQIMSGAFGSDEEVDEFDRIMNEVRHGRERPLPAAREL